MGSCCSMHRDVLNIHNILSTFFHHRWLDDLNFTLISLLGDLYCLPVYSMYKCSSQIYQPIGWSEFLCVL